jgi:6-pyruvoyltetrahydropterin/6-carboxytetrahydropterin synthase
LQGEVVTKDGASEEGMLIDFGDVSRILEEQIHDVVDHAFILYESDNEAIEALSVLGDDHKTLVVPFVPTAENLAKWAFVQIEPFIETAYGNKLRLAAFHVRETPKSWASWAP